MGRKLNRLLTGDGRLLLQLQQDLSLTPWPPVMPKGVLKGLERITGRNGAGGPPAAYLGEGFAHRCVEILAGRRMNPVAQPEESELGPARVDQRPVGEQAIVQQRSAGFDRVGQACASRSADGVEGSG